MALLALLPGCFVSDQSVRDALDRDGDGEQAVGAGGLDCDDERDDVNSTRPEICGDGVDNNCDGAIDDAGVGEGIWFADLDNDGFGETSTRLVSCAQPLGHVDVGDDCDDADPLTHPDADDICDGVDNDCNGQVDNDVFTRAVFLDADGDGYGRTDETIFVCQEVAGYSDLSGDCDDTNSQIHPGAADLCDGVDENCNGTLDEDAIFVPLYVDADGDGRGDVASSILSCDLAVPGYSVAAGDCDDANPAVHDLQVDFCNGRDEDCDGVIDDDAENFPYYVDADGDGYGAGEPSFACSAPEGLVRLTGDCDDADEGLHPDQVDLCDGFDNDCDLQVDEDQPPLAYYLDADSDLYGTGLPTESCEPITGWVTTEGDCDDTTPTIRPNAAEVCNDIDDDCDGMPDDGLLFGFHYADADGDGAGDPSSFVFACDALVPDGYVSGDGDCNDGNANVRPGLPDDCDQVDNDCDGGIDEDEPTVLYFRDDDGDGFGATPSVASCSPVAGHVLNDRDCNDNNAAVQERTFYADLDDDGFGAGPGFVECQASPGRVYRNDDCDDSTDLVSPYQVEVCGDGLDNDCSPLTDCLWEGSNYTSTADYVIDGGGRPIGVLDDVNRDDVLDWWIAEPTRTEIHYGTGGPPNFNATPSHILPAGCLPMSLPAQWASVACLTPGRLEVWEAGFTGSMVVTSTEPSFGAVFGVQADPMGFWVGTSQTIYFFPYSRGAFPLSSTPYGSNVRTTSVFGASSSTSTVITGRSGEVWVLARPTDPLGAAQEFLSVDDVRVGAVRVSPGEYHMFAVEISTTPAAVRLQRSDEAYVNGHPLDLPWRAQTFPGETTDIFPTPAGWAFNTAGFGRRVGLVFDGAVQQTQFTTDVDAWFVDDGGRSLDFASMGHVNGDGREDIVLRRDQDELLVFLRVEQ